jgi:phage terminase large subunit-like protein
MIKEARFSRYRRGECPEKFDQIIQSWDTANKPSELADYSVCTTWGLKGSNFYLLNVLGKRLSFPDLKRAADPPPMNWSTLRYVFGSQEDQNAEEASQAGRDRGEAAPG